MEPFHLDIVDTLVCFCVAPNVLRVQILFCKPVAETLVVRLLGAAPRIVVKLFNLFDDNHMPAQTTQWHSYHFAIIKPLPTKAEGISL